MADFSLGRLIATLAVDAARFNSGLEGAESRFERSHRRMREIGRAGTAAITLPLAGLAALSVKAASDVEEMGSKFDVVFGDLANETRAWAEQTGDAVARSRFDLESYLATIQDTFVPMGFARDQAADLSKTLTALAVDLASFNNAAEPETVNLMTSALVGNHEAVRRYGIQITQATLDQELMNLGIAEGVKGASEQQKVLARLALIIKSSSDAQGDAARTAGSFANMMRGLQAAVKDVAVDIGQRLMPQARLLVSVVTVAAEEFSALDDSTKDLVIRLGLLAAAAPPVILGLGLMLAAVGQILPVVVGLAKGVVAVIGLLNPLALGIAAVAAVALSWVLAFTSAGTALQEMTKEIPILESTTEKAVRFSTNAWLNLEATYRFVAASLIRDMASLFGPSENLGQFLKRQWLETEIAIREKVAGIQESLADFAEGIAALPPGFAQQVFGPVVTGLNQAAGELRDSAERTREPIAEIERQIAELAASLEDPSRLSNRIKASLEAIAQEIEDGIDDLVGRFVAPPRSAADAAESFAEKVKRSLEKVRASANVNFDDVEDRIRQLMQTFENARGDAEAIEVDVGGRIAQSITSVVDGILRGTRQAALGMDTVRDILVSIFTDALAQMIEAKIDFDLKLEKNFLETIPELAKKGAGLAVQAFRAVFGGDDGGGGLLSTLLSAGVSTVTGFFGGGGAAAGATPAASIRTTPEPPGVAAVGAQVAFQPEISIETRTVEPVRASVQESRGVSPRETLRVLIESIVAESFQTRGPVAVAAERTYGFGRRVGSR